jgi:ATP-dependent DNA helicase HFM1/MER3
VDEVYSEVHRSQLSLTKLANKIHVLNENRGSALEVVISRMKMRGSNIRFLMVSATIPNISDIAEWVGNIPGCDAARVFQVCLIF